MEGNPIISKLVNFFIAIWKDIKKKDIVMSNLVILCAYWLITTSSFIVVRRFNDVNPSWPPFRGIIGLIFLIMLGLTFIICMACSLHSIKKRILSLVVFVSCFLGIISFLQLACFHYIRIFILIISAIFFIFLFNFILYSEKIEEKQQKLAHRRYLEYLRSTTWAIVFGLLTFLQIVKDPNVILEYQDYPRRIWFIQLFTIFFGGILLILWAFHVKLKEIEKTK